MTGCPRLTIAGLGGDTGKTALSVGLCRTLMNRGYTVVPFKKGPDYIDMAWLEYGADHACYNLDLFFMDRDQVLTSFIQNTMTADIAVIEGNRGLYDGLDEEGSVSTAEVSKLIRSPVLLIVDCTKVTRTIAALVRGCQVFDPDVEIRGVILNRIAGRRHETIIRESIRKYCGIPVVGAIPKIRHIPFPGRHLGLVPPQEHPMAREAVERAEETIQKHIDIDAVIKIAGKAPSIRAPRKKPTGMSQKPVKIGVIRDSAFQFYYPENLESLQRNGATVHEFSALNGQLPSGLDALYIGGGFPETHADALSSNKTLRNSIRDAAEKGMPVYAECGGLMYLAEELVWEGKTYPMAGVLPLVIGVSKKPRGHGYTLLEVDAPNPFFETGQVLRGHEFHYSYVLDFKDNPDISFCFSVQKGQGILKARDGICYKNVLATYTHLHAVGTTQWAEGLMHMAHSFQKNRGF